MKMINEGILFNQKRRKFVTPKLTIPVFGLISLIGVSSAFPSTFSSSLPEDGVCRTKVCNESAASLLKSMDQTVDPCEDFYHYACGNFIKDIWLQGHENQVSFSTIVQDEIDKQLHQILNTSSTHDQKPLKLLKKLYRSCMDNDKIESIGVSEVVRKIKKLGGWPVVDGDAWDEIGFDWLDATYKSRLLGIPVDFFIAVSVERNYQNIKNHQIYITSPRFTINEMYLKRNDQNETLNAYLNYTVAIAEAFGANKNRAIKEMSEVFDFQKELIIMSWNASTDSELNISQLNEKYPSIPWLKFINLQMPNFQTVHQDDIIRMWGGSYISGLESLIARTPKRTIANYIMSNVALSLVPYLNNEIRAHQLVLKNKISGQTKFPERWQECVESTKLLSKAISSIYIREYSDREKINAVLDIVRLMKEEFVDILQKNDWMDYDSQVHAIAKLATISPCIGYPDDLKDDRKVNEYYEDLELSEDSYLEIALRLEKFNKDKKMAAFRKSGFEHLWTSFARATIVNAYYFIAPQYIQIPVATIHENSFNKDRPKYMNYGNIGWTIGHELGHAFDPDLINYDKDGNYTNWLIEPARQNYNRITDCVTKQYSNYYVADVGMNLNGKQTVNEDMSDIIGIKVAYSAYKQWVKEHGEEQKLPGIDRSSKQLFWLSAANSWCTKSRPRYIADRIITYDHGPAESRVNIPFMNSPEFAEDYKCPLGSKMNPIKKCRVL